MIESFPRDTLRAFRFVRADFDADTGIARLVYAFDDAEGQVGPELTETVSIPGAPFALDAPRAAAAQRALQLLHLIAGVSYYKAGVPPEIRIQGEGIDADTAALLEEVYRNGLGEFAYRNGLDLRERIRFPATSTSSTPSDPLPRSRGRGQGEGAPDLADASVTSPLTPTLSPAGGGEGDKPGNGSSARDAGSISGDPVTADASVASAASDPLPRSRGRGQGEGAPDLADASVTSPLTPTLSPAGGGEGERPIALVAPSRAPALGLRPHALVAIGGGKDSLVSIEALRAAGVEQTVVWIGGSQLIRACAERTGLPTLNIGRQLAPELFELNRLGAYNGHIPVTAVNSAILAFAAVLLGVDQVVFSNERSASYGSIIPGTGEVNHQWSKGWAFERGFGAHLQRHVAADLQYYSLLRPLSELAVARQFARIDRYDAHFSSCNRNFHILGERPASRWCGVCPKCHFVFLALAPFMPKPRLMGIFGRNLLDDATQIPGFDALLEYQDHKPFECVGEGRESRAAMAALAQRPEWREDEVVERFAREVLPQLDATALSLDALLAVDDEHRIPSALWERLHAHFAA